MNFVDLPDHIGCSSRGTFSPVQVRFEGGNHEGGFCIEEYKKSYDDGPKPHVNIYGDPKVARERMKHALSIVISYLQDESNFKKSYWADMARNEWFSLEVRPSGVLRFRITGMFNAVLISSDMGWSDVADVSEAITRLRDIHDRFYDVG